MSDSVHPYRRLLLAALAFLVAAFVGVELWRELGPKRVSGLVYDCATKHPVPGASVELWQQTFLTWDRLFKYRGTSDADGRFTIAYGVGHAVKARATKDGYLLAESFGYPSEQLRIGLRRSAPGQSPLESNPPLQAAVLLHSDDHAERRDRRPRHLQRRSLV